MLSRWELSAAMQQFTRDLRVAQLGDIIGEAAVPAASAGALERAHQLRHGGCMPTRLALTCVQETNVHHISAQHHTYD